MYRGRRPNSRVGKGTKEAHTVEGTQAVRVKAWMPVM